MASGMRLRKGDEVMVITGKDRASAAAFRKYDRAIGP